MKSSLYQVNDKEALMKKIMLIVGLSLLMAFHYAVLAVDETIVSGPGNPSITTYPDGHQEGCCDEGENWCYIVLSEADSF